MNSSLAHLPEVKQEQILDITEIIKEVAGREKNIFFEGQDCFAGLAPT